MIFQEKCGYIPLKAKQQVYNKFIDFYELIIYIYIRTLSEDFKSDRGCEYINNDFNKFICKNVLN